MPKRWLVVALLLAIVCVILLLLVPILGYRRLSANEQRLDHGWNRFIPTQILKQEQQIRDETDISEAVVRFIIAKRDYMEPLCLCTYDKEPSDALMARLRVLNVLVNKVSQVAPPGCGSLIHIDSTSWISPREVKVIGGNYFFMCAGVCPAVGVYRVIKANGSWTVLNYEVWSGSAWYSPFENALNH
jgi:hypothetical protein